MFLIIFNAAIISNYFDELFTPLSSEHDFYWAVHHSHDIQTPDMSNDGADDIFMPDSNQCIRKINVQF